MEQKEETQLKYNSKLSFWHRSFLYIKGRRYTFNYSRLHTEAGFLGQSLSKSMDFAILLPLALVVVAGGLIGSGLRAF